MTSYLLVASAFLVGFILGFSSATYLNREQLSLEKTFSILMVSVWMGLHGVAFLLERDIPFFFDFAGLGAAGNLLGINLVETATSLAKKKK